MGDPVEVKIVSATTTAAFTFPILVRKVVLQHADGAAVLSAALHNGTTSSVTASIGLTTNLADGATFERYAEANFNPPVPMEGGATVNVMISVSGTGTCRVYYNRM
jgi:hypothetical protein